MKQLIFNVNDYGANPDGKHDCTDAVMSAIASAITSGVCAEVVFGEGDYRISGPDDRRYGIPVKDAKNLTISGIEGKTTITITNQKLNGFKVLGGENVTIRNFIMDYDPLPYTQGTIRAVDFEQGTYEILLDEGYEDFTSRIYGETPKGFGLPNRVDGPLNSQFGPWAISAEGFENLHKRLWKVTVSDRDYFANTGLKPGDRYVHKMTLWIDAAISSSQCKNITAENITIHACPGLASMWANNDKVTIRNLNVTIPANSGRLLSSNADGIHAFGNRGGMTVDGCSFYGMADDAINIHARSAVVMEILSPERVVVETGGTTECRPGDQLMIFNVVHGIIKDRVTAVSVENGPNERKQTLTFDKPVSCLVKGSSYMDPAGDNLFNLSACGQGSIITNCKFYAFRGRGVLMNTHDILITNNHFYNVEGWGVSMQNDPTWKEGPPSFDIRIANNHFHGVGFGYAASVYIRSMETPQEGYPSKNIKNISVTDNQFTDIRSSMVGTLGADGLTIRNNIFINSDPRRNPTPGIRLEQTRHVDIANNTLQDTTGKTTAGIFIADSVESEKGGVSIENNQFHFIQDTPEIIDQR